MAEILGLQKVDMPLVDTMEMKTLSAASSLKDTPENLKKAAQEFESFFIYYLLKEMRKTVPQNPMFHGGRAEEIFQEMLDERLALTFAQAGGIGLAPIIYQQLSRQIISTGAAFTEGNDAVDNEDE